jgi:uncharacterized protein
MDGTRKHNTYAHIFWITILVGGLLMPAFDMYRHPPKPQPPEEASLAKTLFYWYKQSVGTGVFMAEEKIADYYYAEENDFEKALFWYEKAAEWGYTSPQYKLAQIYYDREDYENAHLWFTKVTEEAHIPAYYRHPLLLKYDEEAPIRRDAAQAQAEADQAQASFYIGYMYEKGLGVPRSIKFAIENYKIAAEQGHTDAQYNLARRYYIREKYKEAHLWFSKAAEKDHERAIAYLKQMEDKNLVVSNSRDISS